MAPDYSIYKDRVYTRDYLKEAKDIISGKTMLLCEREHLKALNSVIGDMLQMIEVLNAEANSLREGVIKND